MNASESYQLESLPSEADGVKPPSPTASIDPANVRWMNQGGRRWEVGKIVSRIVSTLLCAIMLIICMSWYAHPENDLYDVWPWLSLPGAMMCFMWDLGEFLSVCARHGRGITPKAHIGVEVILSIVAYIGGGWLAFQLGVLQPGQLNNLPIRYALAICVFILITATIHLVLFIRACIERSREIRRRRPRVMYIPETGQTIYVVAKPFPKLPTWKSQQQQQPAARAGSFPRSPQSPVGSSNSNNTSSPLHRHFQQLQLEIPPPLPERWPSELSPSMSSIKRKPVRGIPRNIPAGDRERLLRPSMRPPPEDYEPSPEELERMRRGDAQPQLIMPGDVDIKFATSATGMTPADASAREGKYRVDASQMSGMAPMGEASATGNGRGRRQST
ncbi:hypothetical protein CH063_11957 [Colletotrichum higginsianum]|uniref:Uncharacterized protein n=1 Tax=Colletotrichum higginsianum (strain IMI 349063) TaxID=759273 RepID=H1VNH9_COLHI|nr:hypothetical protein CH063_11957 [Colletotrichum higginsianum]